MCVCNSCLIHGSGKGSDCWEIQKRHVNSCIILLMEPQSHNNTILFTALHHGGKLSRLTLIYSFLFIPFSVCSQIFILFSALVTTLSAFSFGAAWSLFLLICSGKFFSKTDRNWLFNSNSNFTLKATEYIKNLTPTGNASLDKILWTPEISEQNSLYPLHLHVHQIVLNETSVMFMIENITWKNFETLVNHGCV